MQILLYLQHQLAKEPSGFHGFVGFGGLLEGKDLVNDGFYLACVEHGHNLPHVLLGAHVDAEELKLPGKECAHLELRLVAGGDTAVAVPSAAFERVVSGFEELSAYVVDDNVAGPCLLWCSR